MTEKQKKTLALTAAGLACLVLTLGGVRYAVDGDPQAEHGHEIVQPVPPPPTDRSMPDVSTEDIPSEEPEVHIRKPEPADDPGAGADSSGTEQSIQRDPIKPAPSKPPQKPAEEKKPPSQPHKADDVPESERNKPKPPRKEKPKKPAPPPESEKKEPAPGSTNQAGQVYVPGFGYVKDSGTNKGGTLNGMYENGNKIGIMG